jgi:sec-independent protein translocase protein TatC
MPGFDIGHLIAIFFVAFLVLGPTRMVEVARSLGKFSQQAQGEWVKFTQSFQAGLNNTGAESTETEVVPEATSTETVASTETAEGTAATIDGASTTAVSEPVPAIGSEAASPAESGPTPSTAISPLPKAKTKSKKKSKAPKRESQSISEHLIDLRTALVRSLVAIVLLTTVAYIFSDTLLYILRQPAASAGIPKLQALSPMDGFLIHFRVALYGGIFLSAPIWIFEAMRFISPALLPHEKRLIIPGIVAAMALFFLGNLFGYFMLQNMMSVILGSAFFGNELTYLPSADPFISFVVFFLIATGISFELPIVLLIFIRIGWLSPDTLRRQRKVAYFVIFVFAELITPVSDPIVAPMVVMMPMVILFELALLVARLITPKSAKTSTSAS